MDRLSLIDVSLEDDLFLATPSSEVFFDPSSASGLSENHGGNKLSQLEAISEEGEYPIQISKKMEQALHLMDSPEKKCTKSSKYNLRKSLAWDSAFFTSEGVLDPEELATVNCTFKKMEAPALATIPEDTRQSADSTSTLDNDDWPLENLKLDLFENVRTSIQKSFGYCDKASKVSHPDKKKDLMKGHILPIGSSKKVGSSSFIKKKSAVGLERQGVNNQHDISSETSIVVNVGADNRLSLKTLPKPSRILPRSTLATLESKATAASGNPQMTKKAAKSNEDIALAGNVVTKKSVIVSKKLCGGSSISTCRSFQSLKPTNSASMDHRSLANSRSSYCSLGGSSSDSIKSPVESTRKRSVSRNVDHSSSASVSNKTPMKASRTKIVKRNTNNPAIYQNSVLKLSSSTRISPTSSSDSAASEVSSTSVAIKSVTDSFDASSTSSSASFAGHADKDRVCTSGSYSYVRNGDLGNHFDKQSVRNDFQENFVVTELSGEYHSGRCNNINSGKKCFKPSGLRMPTPKIGYFDAEKSKYLTRNVETLSMTNFTNDTTGASKNAFVHKLKISKQPCITPQTPNSQMDSDSLQTDSASLFSTHSMKSTSLEQLQKSAGSCIAPSTVEPHHESSFVAKDFYSVQCEKMESKILRAAAEVTNTADLGKLSYPIAKKQTTEDDAMVISDGTSDLTRKGAKVAYMEDDETEDHNVQMNEWHSEI